MNWNFNKIVSIPIQDVVVEGELMIPEQAGGVVIFSHGSGSSRMSPRNRLMAGYLHQHKIGTLLFDLLTWEEDLLYQNRFDIALLTNRLIGATQWLESLPFMQELSIGYFGASTGAASALNAASKLPQIRAVVSRGGRPDLAGAKALSLLKTPVLLIVGGLDEEVLQLNEQAAARMVCEKRIEIVPGATHLFEEKGAMEKVGELAISWFEKYLFSH
ncbi:dienelactone hydrolase family protein [Flavihumibacter cheonanensis]|uniref:dienelactone hydrolase family protein n=1 Tax=Flavihumibacter cheonanensis TaxID=1442385 RepID=UPI001EF822A5|nr:dienelactone hydrolase family protein [Flavihumibacter cheonanensis]MCG7751264.1 dienelactone hydrolase family protein [Flavihumibacter cheonanensis]